MKIAGRKPLSFVLRCFVYLSAALTVGALGFLIAYILSKGLPHLSLELFAWEYTSDNCSMVPAIINTLEIPEIQKVADRCVVFYEGSIIRTFQHEEVNEHDVMLYSTNAIETIEEAAR